MHRRSILQAGLGLFFGPQLSAQMNQDTLQSAISTLEQSVERGMVDAAVAWVRNGNTEVTRAFGSAPNTDAIFLLASISKPMTMAAVMSLYDRGLFDLDDPAAKYLPEFRGDGREEITIRQLMSHVSGLPDQLPENRALRTANAPLSEFVARSVKTPLLFKPGTKYSYSSMGILLASEIAQRLSGKSIATLTDEAVFQPLEMKHSALGIGRLDPAAMMRCQVEKAAPESGAGDPSAKTWDWNSDYWRGLGAPWGGVNGSAPDVVRFLDAFLQRDASLLKPDSLQQMVTNQNPSGLRRRGLGFELGPSLGGPTLSEHAFGHGGSTGTLCWADPESNTICVVLTTLPSQAVRPHPRTSFSEQVAAAVAQK
jgi:CubicO group peptidase (beta-lactamase class C family)